MPSLQSSRVNQDINQWVNRVLSFSSQYNDGSWSASNVIGPPRVFPNYGDLHGAWAQSNDFHANHFIEFEFPTEVYVEKLNIYETYHAGAIVRIKLRNKKTNTWKTVWESGTGAMNIEQSRIFSPELEKTLFKTNQVRLELDCTVANGYCEIDAIEMIGKPFCVEAVNPEKTLGQDLKNLLLSQEFSDVQFEVHGQIFKAHRNILISRSDYFKNLLCENLRPDRLSKPVHLENITCDGFKALLNYFYTDYIDDETSCETACELSRLSDWYDIPELKETSFEFCQNKLNIDNVIGLFIAAVSQEPKLDNVEDLCLKFIAKNFNSVLERPEFKKLPQSILVKLTQFYAQFQK